MGEDATSREWYRPAPAGSRFRWSLRDNVNFHDGRALTSADVKYTLDTVLASSSGKAASFYEGSGESKKPFSPFNSTGKASPPANNVPRS